MRLKSVEDQGIALPVRLSGHPTVQAPPPSKAGWLSEDSESSPFLGWLWMTREKALSKLFQSQLHKI